jgi:PIN domain nuclease of toxin-antitoxin system
MKFLLDTHLLLWAAGAPKKLSATTLKLLEDSHNQLLFSSASLWEIVIKRSLGRSDFQVDARVFRRGLLDNGYEELAITSEHTVTLESLPLLHKDPFDRILIAQATVEGITLLTADELIIQYPGPIQRV